MGPMCTKLQFTPIRACCGVSIVHATVVNDVLLFATVGTSTHTAQSPQSANRHLAINRISLVTNPLRRWVQCAPNPSSPPLAHAVASALCMLQLSMMCCCSPQSALAHTPHNAHNPPIATWRSIASPWWTTHSGDGSNVHQIPVHPLWRMQWIA